MGAKKIPVALRATGSSKISAAARSVEKHETKAVESAAGWLSADARKIYDKLVKYLTHMNVLDVSDSMNLAIMADTLDTYIRMTKDIREEGEVVEAGGFRVRNQKCLVRSDAFKRWFALSGSFGFTPADRVKVAEACETESAVLSEEAANKQRLFRARDKRGLA